MKKVAIFYDLHDTLVKSESAWLKAFKKYATINYFEIKKLYKSGILRKKICKNYNLNYDIIKKEYKNNLKQNRSVVYILKNLNNYSQYIISNGSRERVLSDLKLFNLDIYINQIYTKENGLKPDKRYIENILNEHSINFAIMIGNKNEEDIFINKNIKSYIIGGPIYNFLLLFQIKRFIKKLK